jgi:CrcB protein|tara:strand:+ start:5407 stop:5766 length:360 start_codon:yes stop_codon:yes gene_type:complete
MKILLICLGGSFGALSRYYLSEALNKLTLINFPIGILSVNFIGCFVLGLLINNLDPKFEHIYHPLLFVGFLGAFTTFSAFTKETIDLISSGNLFLAFVYVLSSVIFCLIGTLLGILVSR